MIAPIETVGRPVMEAMVRWLPALPVAGMDLAPLILAVLLWVVRPRLVDRLADLEARWRAVPATNEAPE